MQCGLLRENALSDAVKEMERRQSAALPFAHMMTSMHMQTTIPEHSTVLLDKRKVNYRITNALSETVHIVSKANPSQLMKAIKAARLSLKIQERLIFLTVLP